MLCSLPSCSRAPQRSLGSLSLSDFSQGCYRTPSVTSLSQEQGGPVAGGCFSPCAGGSHPQGNPRPLSKTWWQWLQVADGLWSLRCPAAPCSCTPCFEKRLRASAWAFCPGMTPSTFELLSEWQVLTMGGYGAPSWCGEPAPCFIPLAGHSDDTGCPPKLLQSRGDLSSRPVGCPPPWDALLFPLLQHPFHPLSQFKPLLGYNWRG